MNYKEILSDKFSNLDEIAKQNQEIYENAQPFPNIVFDNFFNKDFLLRVKNEFPDLSNLKNSQAWKNKNEVKFGNNSYELFKENTRFCFDFLNSQIFLRFLQKITSIKEQLISDPYLQGGGLHEIKKGGLWEKVGVLTISNRHFKNSYEKKDSSLPLFILIRPFLTVIYLVNWNYV